LCKCNQKTATETHSDWKSQKTINVGRYCGTIHFSPSFKPETRAHEWGDYDNWCHKRFVP
jgi:hypothetical protein